MSIYIYITSGSAGKEAAILQHHVSTVVQTLDLLECGRKSTLVQNTSSLCGFEDNVKQSKRQLSVVKHVGLEFSPL